MASSMKENESKNKQCSTEKEEKNQGEGCFPLSNLQFDIVMVLNAKSKALQAYDKYLLDAKVCEEATELFEKMKQTDREQVQQLKEYLAKCLNKE